MTNPVDARAAVIATMLEIGELTPEQAKTLSADPAADFTLDKVNFDSLVVLDFCLRIETSADIIVEPEEISELSTLNELVALLSQRKAA